MLPARVGQRVQAGEVLARVDTTELELDLASAEEGVAFRQAALDALLQGADEVLVEQAEAEHVWQVALARLALKVAQLQMEQARIDEQARLQERAQAVASARNTVAQPELQVAQAQAHPPTVELVTARLTMPRAQDARDAAQIAYQKALDRPWEPQEVRDGLAKALWHAELDLTLAQAQLDGAQAAQRAHAIGVEALMAQRASAQEQLTQTLAVEADCTVTLALLQAEVERAQLQLGDILSPLKRGASGDRGNPLVWQSIAER